MRGKERGGKMWLFRRDSLLVWLILDYFSLSFAWLHVEFLKFLIGLEEDKEKMIILGISWRERERERNGEK